MTKLQTHEKKDKSEIIALVFFFIVGIVFLFLSLHFYISAENFMNNGEKIEAVIVDIKIFEYSDDSDWIVYVEYEVDGETYISFFNGNNWADEVEVGKTVFIRYLKSNPYKIIYAKNEYVSFWITFLWGMLATIFPVARLSYIILNKKANT